MIMIYTTDNQKTKYISDIKNSLTRILKIYLSLVSRLTQYHSILQEKRKQPKTLY